VSSRGNTFGVATGMIRQFPKPDRKTWTIIFPSKPEYEPERNMTTRSTLRPASVCMFAGLIIGLCAGQASAAPYTPSEDSAVLEILPERINPASRELRRLREELRQQPENLSLAIALAKRYLDLGRAESDPRYYGYAEGVLQPWWKAAQPPSDVLLLRATLRQNRHDFDAALQDLAALLKREPRNAQAWLTQAIVHQVRGDYAAAKRSCLPVLQLGSRLAAITCLSQVSSLSGQAEQAYALLLKTVNVSASAPVAERVWAMTSLAEIAVRLGQNDAAETHFRSALELDQRDPYLLAAYADFLLDQNRPSELIGLLKNEDRIDGLLLRLALSSAKASKNNQLNHTVMLEERFAASRLRGESLHEGEEARFTLNLLNKPREALALAQSNWRKQREPRDARILLEAAIAAHEASAAKPVIEFVKTSGLQDTKLAPLIVEIERLL
jgi:tetratricopeptide (TPR) repeat protein